jgi:hypothetical protein
VERGLRRVTPAKASLGCSSPSRARWAARIVSELSSVTMSQQLQ